MDNEYRISLIKEFDLDIPIQNRLFEHFKIETKAFLSSCSFENLNQHRLEFGWDVCDHLEDGITCEDCQKSIPVIPLYPILTNKLLINLLVICGVDGLQIKSDTNWEEELIDWIIFQSSNPLIYTHIQNALKAYKC